jgi:spore coat protein CotH
MKESELISEATEMLNKMKNMPGMGDIQSLLNKMGMGGAKPNMGAMEAQLERNLKTAKMKERLAAKAETNRVAKEQELKQCAGKVVETLEEAKLREEKLLAVFNAGEKAERTPRGAQVQTQPVKQKQKKKGKK